MTDVRKIAEEHFETQTEGAWKGWPGYQAEGAVQDFIAGYRAGLEQAAQEAETSNSQAVSMEDVADAIRKIGESDD